MIMKTKKTNITNKPLSKKLLGRMNAYWRAANYLSVGQLYLRDNPLLREPLKLSQVKSMLLGHWGTTPGQNFIYVHLNRVIKEFDLDMIYVSGPGHGLSLIHISEPTRRTPISYAVFCLKKKKNTHILNQNQKTPTTK